MHVVFDHGAVLVGAVVIGGDGARAVVDAFAHRRITQIRQMIRLHAVRERRIFHLDEVANVNLVAELRAWPQSCERPDHRALARRATIKVAHRMYGGVVANRRISQHAVGADADVVAQRDRANEHAADVDEYVAAADECAAYIDARGVGERDTCIQKFFGFGALHFAL